MLHAHVDLRWWLLSKLAYVPHAGEWYTAITIAIALLFFTSAVYPSFAGRYPLSRGGRVVLSETLFLILMITCIFWSRLHCLLPPSLNPDEPQFIAGAVKLLHDPVFWRSVDAGTSGPLNFYPLTIPAFFGLKLEYASARLVGLVLMVSSVLCLYYALRSLYGTAVARLGAMTVATCVAFMRHLDYVHYSSEHVSIAILSGALLLICRQHARSRCSGGIVALFFTGLLLGAIPYAKLQAVPAAFVLACAALYGAWVFSPGKKAFLMRAGALVCGGIFMSVCVAIALYRFSLWELFIVSYIRHNSFYAQSAQGFSDKCMQALRMMASVADTKLFFSLLAAALAGSILYIAGKFFKIIPAGKLRPLSAVNTFALVLVIAAFFGAAYTGRPFVHYFLFLLMPGGFLIGSFLGEMKAAVTSDKAMGQASKTLLMPVSAALMLICSLESIMPSLVVRTHLPYRALFAQCYPHADPAIINEYAKIMGEHTIKIWGWSPQEYVTSAMRPGVNFSDQARRIEEAIMRQAAAHGADSMAVWGWAGELYVDTGLVPAVRYRANHLQALPSPNQKMYLRLFAEDIEQSKTKLFVDAMPPGMGWWELTPGARAGAYPEIAGILKRSFVQVQEIEGVRIYVRK
ncbi:MAG: hypothetical protein WCG78_01325 [Candidatus Omnitrophota bacterium]